MRIKAPNSKWNPLPLSVSDRKCLLKSFFNIKMLFIILFPLLFSGKDTERFTVSCDVGQAVTLSCKHTMSDCSMVTWILNSTVLVAKGKITGKNKQRSGRLTVGSDCSLHIKNLKTKDTGRYTCRLEEHTHTPSETACPIRGCGEPEPNLATRGGRLKEERTHLGRDTGPSQGTPSGTRTPEPPESKTRSNPLRHRTPVRATSFEN
uniref:Ig-like domain-containing protein n=1 Tax=Scleropages formosus TaxID=113540 RepID=A0A8C9V9X2_SCLFO